MNDCQFLSSVLLSFISSFIPSLSSAAHSTATKKSTHTHTISTNIQGEQCVDTPAVINCDFFFSFFFTQSAHTLICRLQAPEQIKAYPPTVVVDPRSTSLYLQINGQLWPHWPTTTQPNSQSKARLTADCWIFYHSNDSVQFFFFFLLLFTAFSRSLSLPVFSPSLP